MLAMKIQFRILPFLLGFCNVVNAADLSLDRSPTDASIEKTRNGIPLVNINSVKGNGISHNKFNSYNVGKEGLILNNATKITKTKLGGMVQGNANLGNTPARIIINEVTSTQKTQLNGYTEVAGHKAGVIVANPNGITCDGCGFINTPQATLSTGKVNFKGDAVELQVTKGHIDIEGAGLNANNINKLSLISKAIKINAAIYAKELSIITGRNLVNTKTDQITPISGSGKGVSIDSTLLGGIYADRIKLIGTDKGVGVNLQGLVAAGVGGFSLRADGQIEVNGVQTKNKLEIESTSASINLHKNTYAKEQIALRAKTTLTNTGILSGSNELTIKANDINNQGKLITGIDNKGIANGKGSLTLDASNQVSNTGVINTSKTLQIKTKTLNNQKGTIASEAQLHIKASENLINSGVLSGQKEAKITAQTINNQKGILQSEVINLEAQGKINNQAGKIQSQNTLTLKANEIDNRAGKITSGASAVINTNKTITNDSGIIHSNGDLNLTSKSEGVSNKAGLLSSYKALKLTTKLTIDNRQGEIVGDTSVYLKSEVGDIENTLGKIQTEGNQQFTAKAINNNEGTIAGNGDIVIKAQGDISNINGKIISNATLKLSSDKSGLNNQNGTIQSETLNIETDTNINNQQGKILSVGSINITSENLENEKGQIIANEQTNINITKTINNTLGKLSANTLTLINQGSLINKNGEIYAGEQGQLTLKELTNAGNIFSYGNLSINTQKGGLTNEQGHKIISNGTLSLNINGNINNQGDISSNQKINVQATGLTNAKGAVISATEENLLNITGNIINNGRLSAQTNLITKAHTLTNNGGIGAGQNLHLTTTNLNNNKTLYSGKDMYLYTTNRLRNNEGANILSNANLTIAKNDKGEKTNEVINESATIEVLGNASLVAKTFTNKKRQFDKELKQVSKITNTLQDHQVEKLVSAMDEKAKQMLINEGDKIKTDIYFKESGYDFSEGEYYTYYYQNINGQKIKLNEHITNVKNIGNNKYKIKSVSQQDITKKSFALLEPTIKEKQNKGYDLTKKWVQINKPDSYWDDDSSTTPYYMLDVKYSGRKQKETKRKLTIKIEEEFTTQNSDAPKLLIGGHLNIQADNVINKQGLIAADKNITIKAVQLDNQGEEKIRINTKTGRYEYTYRSGGFGGFFGSREYEWVPLPTTRNSEVAGVLSYSTIQAGGNINIDAKQINNTASAQKNSQAPIGLRASSENTQTETSIKQAAQIDITNSLPTKTKHNTTAPLFEAIKLPEGEYGLYLTNTTPGHSYLIESNPAYTNYNNFISSNYMMEHLNLDGDAQIKRLGDSIYENKLIRDQIFAETGRRYLDEKANDYAQYKYLMDNGIKASESLNLAYGVALSPTQINNLTQSIVWMETQVIDGHKVLVPRVYLNQVDIQNFRAGQIVANSLEMNTDNFTNSGSVDVSKNLLIASTGNIKNLGGSLRAGNIFSATADDTFTLISGTIEGDRVNIKANNVLIETATTTKKTQHNTQQTETETLVQDRAGIDSKNGTTIEGINQVNLVGAQLNSGKGDTTIASIGNIKITTAVQDNQHNFDIEGGHNRGQTVSHTKTDITGENVNIISKKGSVLLQGTQVNAKDTIDVQAKDKIVIASVTNKNNQDDYLETKKGFGMKDIASVQINTTKIISSALNANNVKTSSTTLALIGSQIKAEVADITAKTISLASDKNSQYESRFKDRSGLITRTISTDGHLKETTVASTISATKLIFNSKDISDQAKIKQSLLANLSSENPNLTIAQIKTIKATLENKQWHTKTKTLSTVGQLIVQAIATAIAPGTGQLIGSISSAAVEVAVQAALNALSSQLTSQLLTTALTGETPEFDLKALTQSAVQSGLTAGFSAHANGLIANANLNQLSGHLANTVTQAAIQTAVTGGSFEDNILTTAIDNIGKQSANTIGDLTDAGSLQNIISHAALGCALGEAKAGDCGSGAAGAALSAAIAPQIAEAVDNGDGIYSDEEKKQIKAIAQISTVLLTGASGSDVNVAYNTATNEIDNNSLPHLIGAIKGAGVETTLQLLEAMSEGKSLTQAITSLDLSEVGQAALLDGLTAGLGGVKNVHKMAQAYKKYKKAKSTKNVQIAKIDKPQKTLNKTNEITTTGVTDGRSATKSGGAFSKVAPATAKQLQKKFKHAGDFGVSGNYNPANAQKFNQAIQKHLNAPGTKEISGTYRGNPTTFHTDPKSGLTAIQNPNGSFLSGWKLNPQQLQHVLKDGRL